MSELQHTCLDCGASMSREALLCPSCGAVGEPSLVGLTVGDLKVEAEIGSGGMGVVYRAVQPAIGKKLAVKVLRGRFAHDPVQVERLLTEARAVCAAKHPGVIEVFGFGELADKRRYMVMEYLEGRPLNEHLKEHAPLPVSEVVPLLDQLFAALDAAHQAGVIHRDLKPSNVFVVHGIDGHDTLKLLDFGLAKLSDVPYGSAPQTRASHVMGTRGYMAPEQAMGAPVSPQTDLYAAGAIAFLMLTGTRPFIAASDIDELAMHIERQPPAPSSVISAIPPEVDALVLDLLAKKADQRPASAAAVRLRLAHIRKQLHVAQTHVALPLPIELMARTLDADSDPQAQAKAGADLAPTVAQRVRTPPERSVARVALATGGLALLAAAAAVVFVASSEETPPAPVPHVAPPGGVTQPPAPPEEEVTPESDEVEPAPTAATPAPARVRPKRTWGETATARLDACERRLAARPDPLGAKLLEKLREEVGAARSPEERRAVSDRIRSWEQTFGKGEKR